MSRDFSKSLSNWITLGVNKIGPLLGSVGGFPTHSRSTKTLPPQVRLMFPPTSTTAVDQSSFGTPISVSQARLVATTSPVSTPTATLFR